MKKNIAGLALLALNLLWSCQKDDLNTTGSGSNNLSSDYTVTSVLAANATTHEATGDLSWDAATEASIVLNGNSISANTAAVEINGAVATITAAGNYRITGTLNNGQIRVATTDSDPVRLIFGGVNITNANGAALYVVNAAKTVLFLNAGTQNTLSDGVAFVYEDAVAQEPNATLFSHDALTIAGSGALSVTANYADGITSKDGLVLAGSGAISVKAKDDGIRGKDYLAVRSGSLSVTAGGDALKSDNDADATLGFVHLADGVFKLTAGSDAIQAATDLLIEKGIFALVTGGGSTGSVANDSAKGLKAGKHLVVDNGTFDLNTADDALHSNNNLCLNGGSWAIASKDDGIHADTTLSINGGDIVISKSYEGVESRAIAINGGSLRLTASDDGLNAAGGNDGSASNNFPGASAGGNFFILITGGYIAVTATGDGVDANGAIEMRGGTLLVQGPTAQNNGPLDYDSSFKLSGGLLVAVGSAGMAQAPDNSSTQYSILARFSSTLAAGSLIHLRRADGTEILTFKTAKAAQSLAFSAAALQKGETYRLYTGGSHNGTATDGLLEDGTYTPGTQVSEFTISDVVTKL